MNKIKITIVKIIKQVKFGWIVKFNSPYGIAEAKWHHGKTKPKLNFEYYIEIYIPEDLEWGKQINVVKESASELTSDEKHTYLSGILESIDSDGFSVLRIGDNFVHISFDDDLELICKNYIGTYVKIEIETEKIFIKKKFFHEKRDKIEIIYDESTINYNDLIEVFPGKYKERNHPKIFITIENFGYIMPAIRKWYKTKTIDEIGVYEIEVDIWELINKELEKVKQYLANNPNPDTLKDEDVIGFIYKNTENKFKENYKSNLEQLISMIHEFQIWIREKSSSTEYITVLGL